MQDKLFAQPGSTGFNFSSERGVKVFLLTLNRELSPANTSATFNTQHAPPPPDNAIIRGAEFNSLRTQDIAGAK